MELLAFSLAKQVTDPAEMLKRARVKRQDNGARHGKGEVGIYRDENGRNRRGSRQLHSRRTTQCPRRYLSRLQPEGDRQARNGYYTRADVVAGLAASTA